MVTERSRKTEAECWCFQEWRDATVFDPHGCLWLKIMNICWGVSRFWSVSIHLEHPWGCEPWLIHSPWPPTLKTLAEPRFEDRRFQTYLLKMLRKFRRLMRSGCQPKNGWRENGQEIPGFDFCSKNINLQWFPIVFPFNEQFFYMPCWVALSWQLPRANCKWWEAEVVSVAPTAVPQSWDEKYQQVT